MIYNTDLFRDHAKRYKQEFLYLTGGKDKTEGLTKQELKYKTFYKFCEGVVSIINRTQINVFYNALYKAEKLKSSKS